jgi:hypothetical protein
MDHYSKVLEASVDKSYHYFCEFEKYPDRYKKYCQRLEIINRTENTVTTEEIWNMTIGELAHVKIKVKYTLLPNTEIRYEILDGYGKGTKNSTVFTEVNGKTLISAGLVPLDIFLKFYKNTDPVYQRMAKYFVTEDSKLLEGKFDGFKVGDPCPKCESGYLIFIPKSEKSDNMKGQKREGEFFKCDRCNEEFSNFFLGFAETISVPDESNQK